MTREELAKQIVDGLSHKETQFVFVNRHTLFVAVACDSVRPLADLMGEFTAELLTKYCIGHKPTHMGMEFYRRG